MKKIRAQTAIEFVIVFGVVLFFFILFMGVILKNVEDKNSEKEEIILQNVVLSIQSEISFAAEASEGYSREFSVPGNILGKNYEINVYDNRIYATLDKFGISYRVYNFTGNIQKGNNLIRKEGGVVYLN